MRDPADRVRQANRDSLGREGSGARDQKVDGKVSDDGL
jgi:hypothetical protein